MHKVARVKIEAYSRIPCVIFTSAAAADANRPTEPLSLATLGVMGSRHAPGTHSDVESSTGRSKFIGGLRGGP